MATSRELVDVLLTQDEDPYIFGAEAKASDSNPAAFDCSELLEWGCARLKVTPRMPDGSWNQVTHCRNHGTLIPIDKGITTRGALLFKFSSNPFQGSRPSAAHVAVSQGNGKTIEARSSRYGVGQFSAFGRGWTHAALVPGLTYAAAPIPTQEDSQMNAAQEKKLDDLIAAVKKLTEVVAALPAVVARATDKAVWSNNYIEENGVEKRASMKQTVLRMKGAVDILLGRVLNPKAFTDEDVKQMADRIGEFLGDDLTRRVWTELGEIIEAGTGPR